MLQVCQCCACAFYLVGCFRCDELSSIRASVLYLRTYICSSLGSELSYSLPPLRPIIVMAGLADSVASFEQRARGVGLADILPKFRELGFTTYANFALGVEHYS